MLKMRLEANGYKVVAAYNGQEGLEKAKQENPNLIILDLMLPKMDGHQVCRALKTDKDYANIPVVMLTAHGEIESKKQGFAEGAVTYITKPFRPEVLLGIIQGLLRR